MTELRDRIETLTPKRLALLALELDAKLQEMEARRSEPIAVVGIGCRLPGAAPGPDGFWDLLARGRDGVREVPPDRWDIDRYYDPDPDALARMSTRWAGILEGPVGAFDATFFGISRREAVSMDPQHRLLLETAWEALEHAGHDPHALSGSRTGVYVGISTTDYHHLLLRAGTTPSTPTRPAARRIVSQRPGSPMSSICWARTSRSTRPVHRRSWRCTSPARPCVPANV